MKTLNLAALAFAASLVGAASASADEISTVAAGEATAAQSWGVTKLKTHYVKPHKQYKVRSREYNERLRAHLRKRYWGSWSRNYDRYEGFGLRGDGFRTSGKYN